METKHTPGPWSLETVRTQIGSCHKIGPFPGSAAKPGNYACIYADGEYWLTERLTDRGKELLANARLIAAAPELLNACMLLSAVCAGQICNKQGLIDALTAGRNAIAKATGEQP